MCTHWQQPASEERWSWGRRCRVDSFPRERLSQFMGCAGPNFYISRGVQFWTKLTNFCLQNISNPLPLIFVVPFFRFGVPALPETAFSAWNQEKKSFCFLSHQCLEVKFSVSFQGTLSVEIVEAFSSFFITMTSFSCHDHSCRTAFDNPMNKIFLTAVGNCIKKVWKKVCLRIKLLIKSSKLA